VRGAAGAGRYRGTTDAAAGRDGQSARRHRDGDVYLGRQSAGQQVRARRDREFRIGKCPDRRPRDRARRSDRIRVRAAGRSRLTQERGRAATQDPHIRFTTQDAAQLRAGAVDSRLLATLAALASPYTFGVAAFGDASPGVQVLFRDVTLTANGSQSGAAELSALIALVNEQHPPYLPAHAAIIHMPAGQVALRIEFAAPSPLGLLTALLVVDSQPAAATATAIADRGH